MLKSCVAFICLIALNVCINCKPIDYSDDPEYKAVDGFEGDMILNEAQKNALIEGQKARNGLVDVTKRWPNRLVIYKIIGDFDAGQRAAIQLAIDTLEARTCVRFREADETESKVLEITSKTGGCFTSVGYQGKAQGMNLEKYPVGEGCFRTGTILHEFMHALGFYHEQSAAERDDFVQILYDNIKEDKEFNFKKYGPEIVTDFGVGYDYESCLHYSPFAFSANGEPTILPLNPQAKIGQRLNLSKKDIDKINVMYKCPIKI